MKFSMKNLKKGLKSPNMAQQVQDLEKSMKHSLDLKNNNEILSELVLSMMQKLEELGENHIKFVFKETPDTYSFEELKEDIKKLKIDGLA